MKMSSLFDENFLLEFKEYEWFNYNVPTPQGWILFISFPDFSLQQITREVPASLLLLFFCYCFQKIGLWNSKILCDKFWHRNPVPACSITSVMSGLFGALWTVACQAPLSMGFSRQEYWSELPFPPPGDFPDSGIKPVSTALAGEFFTTEPPGKPHRNLGVA